MERKERRHHTRESKTLGRYGERTPGCVRRMGRDEVRLRRVPAPSAFGTDALPGVARFAQRILRVPEPTLVSRCFKSERPNACWLCDVTYIPTREGWLYLAAVLDVYSRRHSPEHESQRELLGQRADG